MSGISGKQLRDLSISFINSRPEWVSLGDATGLIDSWVNLLARMSIQNATTKLHEYMEESLIDPATDDIEDLCEQIADWFYGWSSCVPSFEPFTDT